MTVRIAAGFADAERAEVAALYWAAFAGKLGRVLGPAAKARAFVECGLDPRHALCAYDARGALLGVAGFVSDDGGLVAGAWRDFVRVYGAVGALWRAPLLALLERRAPPERLLMDGVFVAERARGQGVGAALLGAVGEEARRRGRIAVQLDVIDANPRARALYERLGFRPVAVSRTGPLRWLFGFDASTTMIREVSAEALDAAAQIAPRAVFDD